MSELAASGAAAGAEKDRPAAQATTDVTLEVHPDLLPVGLEWAEEHELFTDYIPQARFRILNDLGWFAPAIGVQADSELEPRSFAVRIGSDVLGHFDAVPADAVAFVVDGSRPRKKRQVRRPTKGKWMTSDAEGDPPRGAWDRFEYMVRCLEVVVRKSLDRLVTPQTAGEWLGSTVLVVESDLRDRSVSTHLRNADELLLATETVKLLLGSARVGAATKAGSPVAAHPVSVSATPTE